MVYRARDRRFARDVAIKVLTGALDETAAARFERECHAVGALSGHPHIVVVHDSGTNADGLAYLVMELLPGGSLADVLKAQGPRDWQSTVELGVQLAGALETAHRFGVLHRDVKPENVLFSAYRQPKLVDFGIATVRGGFETKSSSISASLAHAAPEILGGTRASVASDVYALGSTLFQLLDGLPAFVRPEDETLLPLLSRIATEPVPDLRPRGVPDAVAEVIEKAMAKEAGDRFPTAWSFALALQSAGAAAGHAVPGPVVLGVEPGTETSRGKPPELVPLEPPAPRGRRRSALAAAAVLAAGAAGATGIVLSRGGTPPARADQLPTVVFAKASAEGVSASRVWQLDASGQVLSSSTTVTNATNHPIQRLELEVIPDSVAASLDEVDYVPDDVVFNRPARVVRWVAELAPGQTKQFSWKARLGRHISAGGLRGLSDEQHRAQVAMLGQLPAIVRFFSPTKHVQTVPFPDLGELTTAPTPTPSATVTVAPVPTATATAVVVAPTTQLRHTTSPVPGRTTGSTRPPANSAPVLGTISDLAVDELQRASVTFAATDADGDALHYTVTGTLPAGLARTTTGLSGTVSAAALSLTQTYKDLGTRSFAISVTAVDSHGAPSTPRTFHVVVRDTYLTSFPSYIGHYGCRGSGQNCPGEGSLPGLAQLSPSPTFGCTIDDSKSSGSIAYQSQAVGSTFRWGSATSWRFYGTTSGGCG